MNRVNTDPIILSDFVVGNDHLVIDPPLRCEVEFDQDSRCFGLRGDLELVLYAYSRSELLQTLEETLQDWWLVYVESELDDLSESGKQKRREIMSRIKLETKSKQTAD